MGGRAAKAEAPQPSAKARDESAAMMAVTIMALEELRHRDDKYGYVWIQHFAYRSGHLRMSLEQHLRARPDLFIVHMDGGHDGTSFVTTLTAKGRHINIADLIDEGDDN